MTRVITYSRTQSVTYVADNILKSIKDIIRKSGMDPASFINNTNVHMRGLRAWLESEHLKSITLEIYNPTTSKLITRWDIDICYDWSSGEATFWTDTEQLKWAISKAGVVPSRAKYCFILSNHDGYPKVAGWSTCNYRSTNGMVQQCLGSTIEHNGLGASASYWRKAS